ncbi:MAG: methylthioadenosine phosphorylase, partial [Bacilli bacterium]|nr:methylthioadenosine phosphorylase [Bacilli bacterium]
MFGIIGGTGVYDVDLLERVQLIEMSTPYGDVQITAGEYQSKPVAFLPRHGKGHSTPPHLINYRANIWALREFGVTAILSTAAVGSIKREYAPGTLVVVDDFIDFTKSRPLTFHEGQDGVVHVDMTEPYCPRLRRALTETAASQQISL